MKLLNSTITFGVFIIIAASQVLAAQQPSGVARHSYREVATPPPYLRTNAIRGTGSESRQLVVVDSGADAARRRRIYATVGGLAGALVGAVAGNHYARAHRPPCVNVPAGPPCRYLDPDNSDTYKVTGVALGAGLGLLSGLLLSR
jgi:hypothetical protein